MAHARNDGLHATAPAGADEHAGAAASHGRAAAALAGWILLSLGAGALGSVVSGPDAWYDALAKPAFNPPPAVFGPVWTILYILMGVAAWLVWRTPPGAARTTALAWFGLQLVLNAAWSWLFFGWHRLGLALAELVLLWIAIAVTTAHFWRLRRPAGLLLVPYLAWVSFAGVLNAAIWRLNP